jgi:hypothetical protein
VSLEFAVLGVCVVLILRRFVSPALAAIGLVLVIVYRVWSFPHWHIYTYSATALCLLAVALVLMLRFLESGDRRVLAASGLVAGLGVLCKQDYGAAGLLALNLALLLWFVERRARESEPLVPLLLWMNVPALAVGALTIGYFASQGLLVELLRQTVWNHIAGIAAFEYSSLPPVLPLFEQDPGLRDPYGVSVYAPAIVFTADWSGFAKSAFYNDTSLYEIGLKTFFYAPYGLVAIGGWRLFRLRGALRVLLLSLNKPKDYVHMAILYWPMLCLLVVYTSALVRARRSWVPLLAAVALVPAGPALGYTARLAWQLRSEHTELLRDARGGIYVTPSQAVLITGLVDYIREHTAPGDRIAVFPYYPMVSFLADRRGPHSGSYLIWPVGEFEERDRVITDTMDETDTDLVIYHFTQWNQFPRVDAYAPELFAYLVENFEIDRVFSEEGWGYMFAALRRSSGPPEGRPILANDLAGTRLRTERPGEPARFVEGDERGEWVRRELWPFRPVLALRPEDDGGRTVLSVPLEVEAGARLRTAVGVHPRFWFNYPSSSVTFSIGVVAPGDPGPTLLYSKTLDPHLQVPDRRWFEVEIPLDAYADRSVQLEFATSCQRPAGERLEMAGFADPRLGFAEETP